jgi:hypothetical protein
MNLKIFAEMPLTRPVDTLSPSDGERDGVRTHLTWLFPLCAHEPALGIWPRRPTPNPSKEGNIYRAGSFLRFPSLEGLGVGSPGEGSWGEAFVSV